ncbi:hypothetical protein ACFL6W_08220 [Thermodesulfobacteriota bacterium]
MNFKYFLLILVGFCIFQSSARDAQSCSVPVFRYALERWKPDPYKGIYVYRNNISEKDQALLKQLKDASANAESPLNLIIREVDVNSFSKEKLTGILQGPVPDTLPVIIIWYPGQMGKKPPVWKEPLTPSLVKGLIQSPKRQQMAESLIKGESVVWVFLPSGKEKKDTDAKAFIRQELEKALQTYSNNPYSILSGAKRKNLTYGFPIMTVSRDNPAERIFIETLLKSESDLYEHTDEPMVFPVFGRGRVLGCLFGKYITEKNIKESTAFLSGACSCEVKELNPGFDLLVAAPWDMVVMNSFVEDESMPELTGVMPEPEEPAGEVEPPVEKNIEAENNSSLLTIYGATLIAVILVVAVLGFIINRRRRE